jgi:hypothetical protein
MEVGNIIVKDIISVDTAVSTDNGNLVYKKIVEFLNSGNEVHLDFIGITMMTTAFLNAAIGQLYSTYTGEQLNKLLKLVNVADDDKILFKKVIDRAKQYFANKKDFDESADNVIYGS